VSAIIAYGAIASAVIGLLGPVFIPFLVFRQAGFLFWGWLAPSWASASTKSLAAAVFSILGHLLAKYYTQLVAFSDPGNMVQELPLLILLGVRQYLHPVQDSGHDAVPLQRSYRRRQQRPRHGDDGLRAMIYRGKGGMR
jgi:hypothetical protein